MVQLLSLLTLLLGSHSSPVLKAYDEYNDAGRVIVAHVNIGGENEGDFIISTGSAGSCFSDDWVLNEGIDARKQQILSLGGAKFRVPRIGTTNLDLGFYAGGIIGCDILRSAIVGIDLGRRQIFAWAQSPASSKAAVAWLRTNNEHTPLMKLDLIQRSVNSPVSVEATVAGVHGQFVLSTASAWSAVRRHKPISCAEIIPAPEMAHLGEKTHDVCQFVTNDCQLGSSYRVPWLAFNEARKADLGNVESSPYAGVLALQSLGLSRVLIDIKDHQLISLRPTPNEQLSACLSEAIGVPLAANSTTVHFRSDPFKSPLMSTKQVMTSKIVSVDDVPALSLLYLGKINSMLTTLASIYHHRVDEQVFALEFKDGSTLNVRVHR